MQANLWMPDLIRTELAGASGIDDEKDAKKAGKRFEWKLLFGDHHESHAASAFHPSPFEEAAILTIDGVGEWATSSIGTGRGNEITLLKELRFPDSLGLLYSAFTYYTGFKVNSGEYKVMGLAPYGEPKYVSLINPLYWEIINAFRRKTGCPLVVNTSFNVRGEPIVCSPEDSYRCFMRTEMDFLVLETCVLDKRDQPAFVESTDWRADFRLD